MSSTFFFPTKLIVSNDAGADLVNELQGADNESVLILTDQGIIKSGIVGKILLKIAEGGFRPSIYDQVPGNPNLPDIKQVLESVKGKKITHIVAIGGGSVIDTAKAVGLMLADDQLDYEEVQWRRQQIKKGSLPVIAIPTTAGTGSEVTHVAVVGDSKGFKMGVLHPALFLKTAIIDGGLTISLPPKLTAATGMDALVHSIEAFLSKKANNTSDIFALSAIRSIVKWLPIAFTDGENLEARNAMALAASWAGIAFDQSSLGLVHALAGPLCANYHLHHGLGVAVLLPQTMKFNAQAIPAYRWNLLREAIGLPENAEPESIAAWSKDLLTTLEMPVTLSELGVDSSKFDSLAESATKMAMIGMNIRPADLHACKQILEATL
jgi:alcohol dehydrogenase class IV